MSCEKPSEGITFDNISINSVASNSGIFAGQNRQFLWCTDNNTQSGFGIIMGEENLIENPCSVVTDPESSDEMLEYFKKLVETKIGKRGI